MDNFIKKYAIEIENGGFFTPKTPRSTKRELWMDYPTPQLPFYIFEVEEIHLFPPRPVTNKICAIEVMANRVIDGEIVHGDLVRQPLLTFAVNTYFDSEGNLKICYQPLQFTLYKVFDYKLKDFYPVHKDSVTEISREYINYGGKFW